MRDFLTVFFSLDKIVVVSKALLLVLAGLLVARLLSRGLQRLLENRLDRQRVVLMRRITYYSVLSLFFVAGLHQFGFNLGVLLGAAGVLSVALGFASQTSASNLISGLFLIGEQPFAIGDVVQIGSTTGEVLGIDLLSVKLRTFDNRFVRIPNETVIKTEVATLTKFPIRRIDVQIGVAYKEDLDSVREVLCQVADENLMCLDEPKPLFLFQGFGDSALNIQFSVWVSRENFLELKSAIQLDIKRALDEAEIEIPFPHRTLYAGSATRPLPVEIVSSAGEARVI
ncbi:MAG: mechanosensitive ion channel family protein [Acidobacteriota bacterium]|nr:mechanosensitive ion channel family protein [Acidobacteriota bacterium]